ncbi:MAG: sulfurtransferase [Acidimicrobiales bacterium]
MNPSSKPSPFPSPVVTAGWVAAHRSELVLADVRWYLDGRSGAEEFASAHIPGAVFVDLDLDLSARPSRPGGRHPLADPADFAAAMGRLGIAEDTPVVAYDDTGGVTAGRLWWMLSVLGCPVAVLDGGIAAWEGSLESGPVTTTPVERPTRQWPTDRLITTAELHRRLGEPSLVVLDARSADRHRGADHPLDVRRGHVPGARSAPSTANVDGSGALLPAGDLARRYGALGVADAEEVVAYCGSGVSACLDLLAMEVAGYPPGRLYVGSWSAWGADPALPLETGADGAQGGGGADGPAVV